MEGMEKSRDEKRSKMKRDEKKNEGCFYLYKLSSFQIERERHYKQRERSVRRGTQERKRSKETRNMSH